MADGFYDDILSVNAGETSSTIGTASNNLGIVGQTYTVANGGLTVNSGTQTADTGLPYAFTEDGTNHYSYGSNGTWSLTNVGPNPQAGGLLDETDAEDLAGDQYNMSWAFHETVSLAAGDSVELVANSRDFPNNYLVDPTYLQAEVNGGSTLPAAPVVTTSGGTGQNYTLGGSAVAVDSGIDRHFQRRRYHRRRDEDHHATISPGRCPQFHQPKRHHGRLLGWHR